MAHGLGRLGSGGVVPPPTARPYGAMGMRAAGVGLLTTPPQPPSTVIDDFEDGNITEYSGDTGSFAAHGDAKQSGDYGLLDTLGESMGMIYREDNPLSKAHMTQWYHRFGAPTEILAACFVFAFQDISNYYMAGYGTGGLRIYRTLATEQTELAYGELDPDIDADHWYQFNIWWQENNDIRCAITGREAEYCEANDDTWDSGGWGFHLVPDSGRTAYVYWDNVANSPIW